MVAARIDPKLLEILVCPLTKAPLRYDRERQELISEEAGLAYPIRDGIPIMLVDEARPLRDGRGDPGCVRAPARAGPDDARSTSGGPGRSSCGSSGPRSGSRSTSTTASASSCRPNICGSRARRPRCRATARARRSSSPAARHVGIIELEPVGNYAVRIKLRRPARHRHLFLALSLQLGVETRRNSGPTT